MSSLTSIVEPSHCVWCKAPAVFADQDCPVGTRHFCTERCWSLYNALPEQPEGHYGFVQKAPAVIE